MVPLAAADRTGGRHVGAQDLPRARDHVVERRPVIALRPRPALALAHATDGLERIVFASGDPLARKAIFFTTGQTQQSSLADSLGCEINEKGTVRTGKYETTHLTGLYVAGDASRAVQWVVVAAAEGAEAAFAINTDLLKEDLS